MRFSIADCPFCKSKSEFLTDRNRTYEYHCAICGVFAISDKALAIVNTISNKYNLLNCISENIKINSKDGGTSCYWHLNEESLSDSDVGIIPKKLDVFLSMPIVHSNKPIEILLFASKLLDGQSPLAEAEIFKRDILALKVQNSDELYTWLKKLAEENLIEYTKPTTPEIMYPDHSAGGAENPIQARIIIKPQGWDKVFEKRKSLKSKKVFIAMQFDWHDQNEIKKKFVEALKAACHECGYVADIVSEHHTDPIVSKIISEIKESHFVIADFTYNNRGVYFEAGYARALGVPVIHTVMDGHTEDKEDPRKHLHFDIQQINYIKWGSPESLKKKLVERIRNIIE